jgi:hypothetical protein
MPKKGNVGLGRQCQVRGNSEWLCEISEGMRPLEMSRLLLEEEEVHLPLCSLSLAILHRQ